VNDGFDMPENEEMLSRHFFEIYREVGFPLP
jgi:hypothetical protein